MKQQIENIIKENLPEKKEHREFECNGAHNGKGCYEDWCDVETCISKDAMTCKGFNEALSQINTSLIADEVLKVVIMEKGTKNCYWHKWNKWEDINIISSEHINISQIKSCQKCNKKKGRSITYVRKVR